MSANEHFSPKELTIPILVGVVLAILFNHFYALCLAGGGLDGISYARQYFFHPDKIFTFTFDALGISLSLLIVALVLYAYVIYFSKGTFRRGEEHGSSRWATDKEMQAFGDTKVPINNTLLSRFVKLRYDRKGGDYEHFRNRNVLVIGGSGSGKTRGYVKPNLMQIASKENGGVGKNTLALGDQEKYSRSFIITDPKGTTRVETGHMFAEHNYELKEFNTIDFDSSMRYNPIKYIKNEEDVLTFATCLIKNTTPSNASSSDPFWEKSETLLYQALINYMLTEVPEEDRNLITLCDLLDLGQVDEGSSAMSGLDILFAELEHGKSFMPEGSGRSVDQATSMRFASISEESPWKRGNRPPQPNHPGVLAYNSFKSGAAKTLQSILISCKVRLAPLRTERIKKILVGDDMELDMYGDKKMALYLVLSANDPTFNFLHAILLWQMFNGLMVRGTTEYGDQGGALPVGVDFYLDEFANFFIPNFEQTIAVLRSYNIGAHVILQSRAQLKSRYNDNADTIVDCCDTLVFLGGKSTETNKSLEEMMGQQTVSTDNQSKSRGGQMGNSWSEQMAQHGRALMQASEIGKMPMSECLVLISGANPYKGLKTDITKLPMYDWVDPGHKNAHFNRGFDFAAYKSNPLYYQAGDAKLKVSVEERLFTNYPLLVHPPRREAITLLKTLVIENVGDTCAYNVRGAVHFDAHCITNDEAKENKTEIPFPLMEPFGTSDGLNFVRSETRSNRIEVRPENRGKSLDWIEWNDPDHLYRLFGINLEPGQSIRYIVGLSCNTDSIITCIKGTYNTLSYDAAGTKFCDFGFDFASKVLCANSDSINSFSSTKLRVFDTGFCELSNLDEKNKTLEDFIISDNTDALPEFLMNEVLHNEETAGDES